MPIDRSIGKKQPRVQQDPGSDPSSCSRRPLVLPRHLTRGSLACLSRAVDGGSELERPLVSLLRRDSARGFPRRSFAQSAFGECERHGPVMDRACFPNSQGPNSHPPSTSPILSRRALPPDPCLEAWAAERTTLGITNRRHRGSALASSKHFLVTFHIIPMLFPARLSTFRDKVVKATWWLAYCWPIRSVC